MLALLLFLVLVGHVDRNEPRLIQPTKRIRLLEIHNSNICLGHDFNNQSKKASKNYFFIGLAEYLGYMPSLFIDYTDINLTHQLELVIRRPAHLGEGQTPLDTLQVFARTLIRHDMGLIVTFGQLFSR
jgi:hypothetical protein